MFINIFNFFIILHFHSMCDHLERKDITLGPYVVIKNETKDIWKICEHYTHNASLAANN